MDPFPTRLPWRSSKPRRCSRARAHAPFRTKLPGNAQTIEVTGRRPAFEDQERERERARFAAIHLGAKLKPRTTFRLCATLGRWPIRTLYVGPWHLVRACRRLIFARAARNRRRVSHKRRAPGKRLHRANSAPCWPRGRPQPAAHCAGLDAVPRKHRVRRLLVRRADGARLPSPRSGLLLISKRQTLT
jgi:hypothetical protein